MQMDAEFKKDQIGTHFVWVGAMGGGLEGVGGPSGGSSTKSICAFRQNVFPPPGSCENSEKSFLNMCD